jgi:hypothetical protein
MKAITTFLFLALINVAHASESSMEENIFKWAGANLAVSFPQTYILQNDNTTLLSRLTFENKEDYISSIEESKTPDTNLIPILEKNFPKVWDAIQTEFKQSKKVILTVKVSEKLAACEPCSIQQATLQEKNYFEMPHINLVLTK